MKKTDLFRLLRQAVVTYPEGNEAHDRLNAWAVLRSYTDLNADNLGRTVLDKDLPYFYSRLWEARGWTPSAIQVEWPALLAIELEGYVENQMEDGRFKVCRNIQLSVVYPNVEKLDPTLQATCKALVTDEIYDLTESLLLNIITYLKQVVYATPEGGDPAWWSKAFLDYMVGQGTITGYKVHDRETYTFRKGLTARNAAPVIQSIDDASVHKVCGRTVTLVICESACPDPVTFNYSNPNCCYQL